MRWSSNAHRPSTLVSTILALLVCAEPIASREQEDPPAPPAEASEPERPKPEPFAFADFSWVPGNYGASERPLSFKAFTGEVRVDTAYHYSFNRPEDNTISGSSEVFRHNELQLTHLGVGGDLNYKNVQARIMTQFGQYSFTTPRNDASPARGQWNLDGAYRHISEAYGGYHVDKLNGINIQAGIFMSYVGLWSYYNFDNWTYQPSYVSSNTRWFFNGIRAQIYTSDKLKIEPWLLNGWQSYGKFNDAPGVGLQVLWRPNGWLSILGNQYYWADTLGNERRKRVHSDNSIMMKYYDKPDKVLSKAAFSVTIDAGCEYGGGVECRGGSEESPSQFFLGFMAYNRLWFSRDRFGLTIGGGRDQQPGPVSGSDTADQRRNRFLGDTLLYGQSRRPIPGLGCADHDRLHAEPFHHIPSGVQPPLRNVPYFSGRGGVTPPGGNEDPPGSTVPGFTPDLRKNENRMTFALLVKM